MLLNSIHLSKLLFSSIAAISQKLILWYILNLLKMSVNFTKKVSEDKCRKFHSTRYFTTVDQVGWQIHTKYHYEGNNSFPYCTASARAGGCVCHQNNSQRTNLNSVLNCGYVHHSGGTLIFDLSKVKAKTRGQVDLIMEQHNPVQQLPKVQV